MTLAACMDRIVAGVEALEPELQSRFGRSFVHYPGGNRADSLPPSRGFFFEIPAHAVDGAMCIPNARHWFADINAVFAYRGWENSYELLKAMSADFQLLTGWFTDPAKYNTATTGLISLLREDRETLTADYAAADDVDGQAMLLVFKLPVTYRDV